MKLLKVAFLATAILCCAFSAQAKTEAKVLSFDLSAGSVNSQYRIDGYNATTYRYGYHVGAGLTFKIPILSISPEIRYSNSSFDVETSQLFGDRCEVRDQRIDVPVVVGLNLLGPIRLEAGPVFSIYNKAEASYYGGVNDTESFGRIHPELGYMLGVNMTIARTVVVGARFNGQFEAQRMNYYNYKVRCNSYYLTLGFRL